MYTPNLESARESKYLALKEHKREKIKTVFKDDARRCLLSTFLAPCRQLNSTPLHSSLFLCVHFENLKFPEVTV